MSQSIHERQSAEIYFCDNPEGISTLTRKSIPQEIWAEMRNFQNLDTRYNLKILFFIAEWVVASWIELNTEIIALQILCYFLMAFSVVGLPILMHESCHSLLSKDPRLNRWLGFVCGLPGLVAVSAYRSIHTAHHAKTRTDQDPDDIEGTAKNSVSPVFAYYFTLIVGIYLYIPTVAVKGYQKARNTQRTDIMVEYAFMMTLYAVVFLLFPVAAVIKLWIIPLLIAGQLSNVRGIAEHGLMTGGNEFTDTRTVLSNRFVTFMMCNLNYHLAHHLFPGIPWYHLPKVHQLLKEYFVSAGASVYPSYTRLLLDFVRLTLTKGITPNVRLIPVQMREEICA
ncbi:MAG: fatty acid desaturase [Ignavibacteriales bacterium]|nr:fatty acid desaturase [Ignavibacteriales bacterium]